MRKYKLIIAITLVFTLLGASFAYAETSNNFKDLKDTNWAYKYVDKLVKKGGIKGYPDNTFRPTGTITNAEFLKTVVGATLGECKATDKHWASGYMQKALEEGIIRDGELAREKWDNPITRQKMAVVIARTCEYVLKEDIACTNRDEIKASIIDYEGLCEFCKDSIVDVYAKGIITGYPDGTFGGSKTATRAEASTMIVKMLESSERTEWKPIKIETGNVKDIVKNASSFVNSGDGSINQALKDSTTYTIAPSAAPYNLSLGERNGVKWINATGLGLQYLMKDGMIVELMSATPQPDGSSQADYDTDITKIDYIVSVVPSQKTMLLIPNPFKR